MKLSNIFESLLSEASGGKYHVRFNLDKIKDKLTGKSINMTWKVMTNKPLTQGNELDFNPEELMNSDAFKSVPNGGVTNNFYSKSFTLTLTNCKLVNTNPSKGYAIKCFDSKGVIAGVDATGVKVDFGFTEPSGEELVYNPRMVPHWLRRVDMDPFKELDNDFNVELASMGDGIKENDESVENGNNKPKINVYISCVNKITPPPKTKYFKVELNGVRYVKVVEEKVTDYKASGDVYRIADGDKVGTIRSSGSRLFSVS